MRLCSGHNFTFLIVNLIAQVRISLINDLTDFFHLKNLITLMKNDIWFVDKNENWPKGAYAEYMLKLLLLDDIE